MIRRLALLLLVCVVGGAGVAAAQAVQADTADAQAPPTQLWKEFPLDNGVATTPASPTVTAQSPAATPVTPSTTANAPSSGSVDSVDLLVWVLVALIALPIVALSVRGVVRRRHDATEREPQRALRPSVAGQAGTLAPLAPAVGRRRARREPRVEIPQDDEDDRDDRDEDAPRDLVPWNLEDTRPAHAGVFDDEPEPEPHDLVAEEEPEDDTVRVEDEPEPVVDEEPELADADPEFADEEPEPVEDEAELAEEEPESVADEEPEPVTDEEPEPVEDEEPELVQDELTEEDPLDEEPATEDELVEAEAHEALEPDGMITVEDHRERREERAPMPTIDHEHPSRTSLAVATTYEIVWYRSDERLTFALQPVDGRIDPGARRKSGSFVWNQDNDPPSSLRTAQRAHGRLRARLLREGWTAAGRGTTWFSHRFHPPENLAEPSPEDLPEDR